MPDPTTWILYACRKKLNVNVAVGSGSGRAISETSPLRPRTTMLLWSHHAAEDTTTY